MMYLFKKSTKLLSYTVKDVPTDVTITGASWALKRKPSDSDADALILISVDTSPGAWGQVADDGASGVGKVDFYIDSSSISDAEDSDAYYWAAAKLTLSNSAEFILPESLEAVRLRPAGVEA